MRICRTIIYSILGTVIANNALSADADTNKNMKIIEKEGYVEIRQEGGPVLGYNSCSGLKIIEKDGCFFKSFDGSDELKPYEDWRLSAEERAKDLAGRLTIEEIAGLMLYSPQNKLPMLANDTYSGKKYDESGANPWDLSDGQLKFLKIDNVRHVLVSTVESATTAARWNNKVQALVESLGHGIPANNSSDPRHSAFNDAEFAPGSSGQLSMWSNLMGLASCMDMEIVKDFARTARDEYRHLGLATALSPQADLGTDPRWYRFNATFGNDPKLTADIVRAYCDGLQSSPESQDGNWGPGSVNAMIKHWPGGGSGEGGRDAHYGNGKFAVYPGGCFEIHKYPFVHGAFELEGATGKASAVMPYYTISWNQSDENVGNSFSRDIITHQLRERCGYDGVVCTDWVITADYKDPGIHSAKPWGVENLSVAERHYKALMAGVDQFGGNNDKQPVLEAYKIGCERHGEKWMRERMELSARRLLLNIFRTGLFENPYVDVEECNLRVGNPDYMQKGYMQQIKSIVMLKNSNGLLPLREKENGSRISVYIPERNLPPIRTYWGNIEPARTERPVDESMSGKYFDIASTPEEADVAIVFIDSPKSMGMGYSREDASSGGNGYIPISLQYRPYTAKSAREKSIAADPADGVANRSYKDKTTFTQNECDLDLLEDVKKRMGDKPVILVIAMSNPTVLKEVEPLADAILIGFSVQSQAFLEIISGKYEPSGLLPFELPASMEAIETHCEDKPHDIVPYRDEDGNVYKFTFGLNFKGEISDWRTEKYGEPSAVSDCKNSE